MEEISGVSDITNSNPEENTTAADVPEAPKKRRRTFPSLKQKIAFNLIGQGVKPVEAMRRAGYAETTAQSPKAKLFRANAVLGMAERVKDELMHQDITPVLIAKKIKQFLNAQKIDPDDYTVQSNALKLLLEIYNIKEVDKTLKRRMTLEEFVGAEVETGANGEP